MMGCQAIVYQRYGLTMNQRDSKPPLRTALSYVGTALLVVGGLLFLSTFWTAALNFGNFDNFEERGRSMATRAVGGMTLMIFSAIISGAASGRRGRWSVGTPDGAKNATREIMAQIAEGLKEAPKARPVHCQYCNSLNDPSNSKCVSCGAALAGEKRCAACGKQNNPDARFCNQCGKALA
jgi:hypothetical protein